MEKIIIRKYDARVEYAQELRQQAYLAACCSNSHHERRENERSLLPLLKELPAAALFKPAPAVPVVTDGVNATALLATPDNAQKEEPQPALQDWVMVQA